MSETRSVDKYIEDERLSLRIVQTPAGRMALAGDNSCLYACFFVSSSSMAIKARGQESLHLQLALEFLDCYRRDFRCTIDAYIKKGLVLDMDLLSDKQKSVYSQLLKIGPGKTIAYGDLASISGVPRGGRFAGNAMALNRFPIMIPCHRVITAGSRVGRYTGGDEKKVVLLTHEGIRIVGNKIV